LNSKFESSQIHITGLYLSQACIQIKAKVIILQMAYFWMPCHDEYVMSLCRHVDPFLCMASDALLRVHPDAFSKLTHVSSYTNPPSYTRNHDHTAYKVCARHLQGKPLRQAYHGKDVHTGMRCTHALSLIQGTHDDTHPHLSALQIITLAGLVSVTYTYPWLSMQMNTGRHACLVLIRVPALSNTAI
jgi:hypothetical protein